MVIVLHVFGAGCSTTSTHSAERRPSLPDYSRPLPPGQPALELVTDPHRLPDLAAAFDDHDALQQVAIDQSLRWFKAPSSQKFFPLQDITHEQAEASVRAMGQLLERSPDGSAFASEVFRLFDVYQSVGYDGRGTVLFTGYYAPIFPASLTRTSRFTAPLFARPEDLVTDPKTGKPLGRRTADGSIVPYYSRQEIVEKSLFAGNEILWLEDDLSAYIVHVNGSAKLRLEDGAVMYVGYAGKTDRPYASLGQALVRAGLLQEDEVTLPAIRQLYRRQPEAVQRCMMENENYVFFTEYAGSNWPAGSLGVQVTAETSLATDKSIYPRGGVVLVDTRTITFTGETRRFLRLMLDQDTGGAIEAPGRADIFMGIGPGAEILAGDQHAEGKLYYFFLKPEHVGQFAEEAPLLQVRRN